MKKNIITATGFIVLMSASAYAEDKAITTVKKDVAPAKTTAVKSVSIADVSPMVNASIGFVESYTVMGEGDSGKDFRKNVEEKHSLARHDLQEEAKNLEKAKADYLAKSTTMNPTALAKEEKRLVKMENDLKELATELEEGVRYEMQVATENLARELEVAVAQLAEREHLDVVFDKMTGRAIYVSEKFDYTAEAIEQANKNYEVKLAQNKQAEQAAVKVAENKPAASKPAKAA